MNKLLSYDLTKSKYDFLINICKIVVIVISAVYLLGNFIPFYEGSDSYLYGIESIMLSQGKYQIPNPLFEETIRFGFAGTNWIPTIHDTMIPIAGIGTPILGAFAFTLGSYYGLFYLGPILGILLLIVYERITTSLFGKYVGFIALLFFASCHVFFRSALLLNTDAILTLFFITGIFYLIKFLKNHDENKILLSSIFFAISCLIKGPALVFFPLEIITIFAFFAIQIKKEKTAFSNSTNFNTKSEILVINRKKLLKISLFVIIPWIAFFGFWFSYNDYFFGSPTSTYFSVLTEGELTTTSRIQTLLTLEQRDYEQFKDYSKYLLPYQISAIYNRLDNNLDETLGQHWPGLITIPLLVLILFFALKETNHRIEFLVMIFFIVGIIGIYSGQTSQERAELGLPARYMLPTIVLSFMLWSYLIIRGLNTLKIKKQKYLRIFFVTLLSVFFIFAFVFIPPIQFFIGENNFKNPLIASERYPIDKEGIDENSILLVENTDYAIEYGAIPFKLHTSQKWNSEKTKILQNVIEKGYAIYAFKQPTTLSEQQSIQYILENHGVILQDHSKSFCKLYFNNTLTKTDNVCISKFIPLEKNKKHSFSFLN